MIEKSCAFNTTHMKSFIDHITPLASLLNIPLIVSDEKNAILTHHYYPEVKVRFWPDLEFRLKEVVEEFDVLFDCDYWAYNQKNIFQLHTKKQMRLIFCPHGQSDKGYNSSFLAPYAYQETVLLYGNLMKEMLIDLLLWDTIPNHAFIGNFRYRYYLKNRERLLKTTHAEIFSRMNISNPTLLFAPTWNDYEGSGTFFEFAERLLNELPSDWNLVIKVHPDLAYHDPALFYRLSFIEEKRPNFMFVDNFPLIYPILELIDVYLGDYSSIGYDFLVFQKPMFFLEKPHLRNAKLHGCGIVLDPTENFYKSIERHLSKPHQFKDAQKALYQRAFACIEDIAVSLQSVLFKNI